MTREDRTKLIKHLEFSRELGVTYVLTDDDVDEIIKALEQQPCEDAISRQAVLDEMIQIGMETFKTYNDYSKLFDFVDNMPSVTPQPKTGHWIEKDGYDGDTYYDCSECGEIWVAIEGTPWDNGMNYCPNCGAKMEVEE
ncbi:MAG: hypothetical protein IJS61_03405 [Firmicutes bacterium]|nr:hypothetical protein [Bacillota bacterium]